MKQWLALPGLMFGVCALACAQQTAGGRVVVPARNTSHPRVVNAHVLNGAITVKTYSGKEVIVETGPATATHRRGDPTVDGMRRIDMPARGLEVTEEDNVITVHNGMNGNSDLIITVPIDTSLKLKANNGAITADGVHGEVEADSLNGHITLTNISGTVTAHSLNGPMKVTMDRVDSGKPLSFSTLNGGIEVTLPADLKANVTVKTDHGSLYSDFDITLGGASAITEKNDTPDGKFRVRIDRTIRGTINGGGTEITFHTFNGRVVIGKKK